MPAVREMIDIDEDDLAELFRRPDMAASALLGYELDDFQSAELKMDWFFPFTLNLSGTSTGKTLLMWITSQLRCIMLNGTEKAPGHLAGMYFPNFGGVGQKQFWPYFEHTMERWPRFRRELKTYRKKVHEELGGSCWSMNYRNGSRLDMPAPDFLNDAASQAGLRFNSLWVDEIFEIAAKSRGVDRKLLGRVTREAQSTEHPWLCNHTHMMGHAQSPSHPGYKYVDAYTRKMKDGSTRYKVYSFCHRDVSDNPRFRKLLANEENIANQKASMSPSQFANQILGLTDREGITFYPEPVLEACGGRRFVPEERRATNAHYILGFDAAPGQGLKSDWAAASILRVREVPVSEVHLQGMINGERVTFVRVGSRAFELCFVWAWRGQNLGAMDMAALIQTWHRLFHFSSIVLDPGGGGSLVYKEILKPEVELNGTRWRVTPLCTRWEPAQGDKLAIVHWFSRGNGRGTGPGDFNDLPHMEAQQGLDWSQDDGGFVHAAHNQFAARWHSGVMSYPALRKFRDPAEVAMWSATQRILQDRIEEGIAQLGKVRKRLTKEGALETTQRGFNRFTSSIKKDIAYSMLFAGMGAELLMHGDGTGDDDTDGAFG